MLAFGDVVVIGGVGVLDDLQPLALPSSMLSLSFVEPKYGSMSEPVAVDDALPPRLALI